MTVMSEIDWGVNDDFDDDYAEEAERDEWVLACGYPGCCMPGYHFRSECHNAADMQAMYDQYARDELGKTDE